MSSFLYLFKEGIRSLWKNRTMSIASIGVLISCLLLTGVAGLLSINLNVIMKSVEQSNSITIYLEDSVPRLTALKFGEELRSVPNIKDYTFVSKEDGIKSVINLLDEDGDIFSSLTGNDNFLPDAYRITMKDLSLYDKTIEQINALEGVDKISEYSDTANKLSNLEKIVRYASIAIVLILAIVSLFIISNTIKVTMFSRRMEINIMKSVGATNWFVRVPFIVEGLIIGIISGFISSGLLILAYHKLVEVVYGIVPFLTTVDIDPLTGWIVIAYAIVGMLFGVVAGGISIGKYLKKEGENAIV